MPDKPRWTLLHHNLAAHKLTAMRDGATSAKHFRRLMHQMGLLLCSEMTRDLPLGMGKPIITPEKNEALNARLDQSELVVMPILRSGLPLGDAFLELLPNARVGHIGIYRDEENEHHCYMLSLPRERTATFFVLDPAITRGDTPSMAVDYLLRGGVPAENIRFGCLIASTEGLERFYADERFHAVKIYTFCDTDRLDDRSFLVPGMGNIGQRLFRTQE